MYPPVDCIHLLVHVVIKRMSLRTLCISMACHSWIAVCFTCSRVVWSSTSWYTTHFNWSQWCLIEFRSGDDVGHSITMVLCLANHNINPSCIVALHYLVARYSSAPQNCTKMILQCSMWCNTISCGVTRGGYESEVTWGEGRGGGGL